MSLVDGKVVLQWQGGKAPYQLQTRTSLEADWQNSGPAVSETSAAIQPAGVQSYFQLISEATARYRVEFHSAWSATTHPDGFPPGPHWSGLVGGTHNGNVTFWAEGSAASLGIKNMAELGSKIALLQDVIAAIANGSAWSELSGGGINPSPGTVSLTFDVHRDYPLVTLTSMIAPSPDWFVGVAGLSLIENNRWIEEKTADLFLYDAGTDSGASHTAPDSVTTPPEPIRRIEGFPASVNGQLTTFGTFRFTRM